MRLKQAKREAGIGRVKAGKMTGVDASTIYRIEAGLRTPGIETATRICRGLGLDVRRIDEFRPALEEAEAAGVVITGLQSEEG